MPNIFISYRRNDTAYVASMLHERLALEFGTESVFLDVDNIPLGVDIRGYIDSAVGKCDVILVLIGDQWLTECLRRVNDEIDFVRIEVESALNRSIPVIPVLAGSASMPAEGELPTSISSLAFRNASELRSGRNVRHHLDELVKGVEELFAKSRATSAANPSGGGQISDDTASRRRELESEGTLNRQSTEVNALESKPAMAKVARVLQNHAVALTPRNDKAVVEAKKNRAVEVFLALVVLFLAIGALRAIGETIYSYSFSYSMSLPSTLTPSIEDTLEPDLQSAVITQAPEEQSPPQNDYKFISWGFISGGAFGLIAGLVVILASNGIRWYYFSCFAAIVLAAIAGYCLFDLPTQPEPNPATPYPPIGALGGFTFALEIALLIILQSRLKLPVALLIGFIVATVIVCTALGQFTNAADLKFRLLDGALVAVYGIAAFLLARILCNLLSIGNSS